MKKLMSFLVLVCSIYQCYSQPSFIFEGGDGSKFGAYEQLHTNKFLFEGGDESGYAVHREIASDKFLFEGGDESGYYVLDDITIDKYLFEGGNGSGFSIFNEIAVGKYLFEGGTEDGYSFISYLEPFIWTGTIGQSWSVAGNWSFNKIPGIFRKTIIPAGVPFYPHVNGGVFAIGDNPNNGFFKSGEIWIQEGALLVTRVNCKVENYGLITIDGEMRIMKIESDAFINMAEGHIQINSTGLLKFE